MGWRVVGLCARVKEGVLGSIVVEDGGCVSYVLMLRCVCRPRRLGSGSGRVGCKEKHWRLEVDCGRSEKSSVNRDICRFSNITT